MYRDCAACDFNYNDCPPVSSLDILVSSNVQSNYTRLGVIGLKKVSSTEIPGFCKEVVTTCMNKNSAYTGIQQVVFEGYYDFDTLRSSQCKLEIGLRLDSRANVYGTGSDNYYNFAYLNLCDAAGYNNSAIFNNSILHQVNINNKLTYNALAFDPDGDSLSYEFANALDDFNKSITYASSFNKNQPFTCRDISINPKTGLVSFTPIKYGEQGFLVIQVHEWRKTNNGYIKIGTTRRDNLWQVRDFANNSTRILSNFDSLNVCIGNDLSVDFNIFDNNSTDTVKLSYYFQGKQGTLSKSINGSYSSYDAGFTTKIDNTFIPGKTYDLTILTDDGICPWNSKSAVTVRVKIFKELQPGFTVKYQNCNVLTAKASKVNAGATNSFFLFKDNSLIDNIDGDLVSFSLNSGGKYKVRHLIYSAESGCRIETEQEIIVPNFSTPVINTLVWPQKVCKNTELVLKATIQKGTAPFTNVWNSSVVADSLKIVIAKKETITLMVTDVNGCKAKAELSVAPYPVSEFSSRDTSFCYVAGLKPIELNKKVDVVSGKISTIKWFPNSIMGSIDASQPANPRFIMAGPFNNRLGLLVIDEYGCKYPDEIVIKAVKLEPTNISASQFNLCSNQPKTDLYTLTGCTLANGSWFIRSNNTPLSENRYFNPMGLRPGKVQVNFTKKMDEGCFVNDSVSLTIIAPPSTAIATGDTSYSCNTATTLQLTAVPNGGEWLAPNIYGRINPSEEAENNKNNLLAVYRYTDPSTGCSGFDTSIIHINKTALLQPISNSHICAGERFVKTFTASNVKAYEITQTSGNPDLLKGYRLSDHGYRFEAGNTENEQSICFNVKADALQGCPNVSTDFCVIVKPKPVIDLQVSSHSGCAPLSSNAIVKSLKIAPDSIIWKDIEGRYTNITHKNYSLTQPGNYFVDVYAIANGCSSDIAEKSITVYPAIQSNFAIEPGMQSQSSDYPVFTFNDNTDFTGNYTRSWTFESGNPATSINKKESVMFPRVKGIYTVVLTTTTDKGCTDTKTTKVKVEPGFTFFAPNVFTPDKKGPEANEEFKIVTDSCISFHLLIKNKWGETLFETTDQNRGWNGNANGSPAPNGGYVYLVTGRTKFGRYFEEKGVFLLTR